jgi:hypothetical protein
LVQGGDSAVLLVGFHGGDGPDAINNVRAFPGGDSPYELLAASEQSLTELRKFLFDPNVGYFLYVVNALKTESRILLYMGLKLVNGNQWRYEGVYVSDELHHPFDVVFAFDGHMYVSSQDSRRITSYSERGAEAVRFGPEYKKLRGLAYDVGREQLYVADAEGQAGEGRGDTGCVYVLDRYAQPRCTPIEVHEPVHLAYDQAHGWLFIGSESKNAVYAWNPASPSSPPVKVVWNETGQPNVKATAGIALEEGGSPEYATLYVASRLGKQILSYPLDFSSGAPVWSPRKASIALDEAQLGENPEFVGIEGATYG